jgi:transcriptional regulator with XRE-family HTH domain
MATMIIGGELIRAEREKRGLTQTQLARILGVTHSAVSHWESGRTEIAPSTARRVAGWLESKGTQVASGLVGRNSRTSGGMPKTIDIELMIDADLADKAVEYGIDLNDLADKAVRDALARVEAERWQRDNSQALAAMSDRIDTEGVAGEEHRAYG